jgi:outer membrane protein assembly factor BamB/predicted phosphodiesterase
LFGDNPLETAVRSATIIAVNRLNFVRLIALAVALCLLQAHAESPSFRFVFLSDTHVGSTTGEEDLRAAVRDINAMTNLSFVVLSGDVTEYGALEQFKLAHEILSGIKIPCYVVPGNHDTKWSESGATDFPRIFGNEHFNFEFGGMRFIGIHQGPLMKMGDGFWSPQDVRWLTETLRNLPDKNQPLVFVTHYPIDDGIANWFEVLDLLKRYNTQVVLCGHGHRNKALEFEGMPGVMGRSNLRAAAEVGGFNVVEVADGKMTFHQHLHSGTNSTPWHEVVLQKHDYAGDTNKYPRPDYSMNARYKNVKERWQFSSGFTFASTPALWKDLAIVGDASGTVYAFVLKTGDIKWKFKAKSAVYSTPDVSGDRVVFGSTDGNVYALNAADGEQLWHFETGRPLVACPKISDGTVFIGGSDGAFRALNLSDGKRRWEYGGVSGFVETRPLLYAGKIIFGAWDGQLYALDVKSGSLLWKWRGERPGALLSPAACWPVAADGKVFIVAPDRKMTAINAKTGEQLWRSGEFEVRESIGLSEDGRRVYVRAMNNFLYALSAAASGPQQIWKTDGGFGYDINSAMLVERGGSVFYGTKNGLLLALDGKTGTMKWQHKVGTGVVNTLVPLSNKEVLATDFSGKITLVAVE